MTELALVLAAVALITAAYLGWLLYAGARREAMLRSQQGELLTRAADLTAANEAYASENARLAPYAGIADADAKAREIVDRAAARLDAANAEAEALVTGARRRAEEMVAALTLDATMARDQAKRDAEALVAEAKQRARGLSDAAQTALDRALRQSTRIEDEARQRAEAVVSGATVDATTTRDEAERNAEALVADAKQRAKSLREAAQAALDLALRQSTRIEDEARQRAEAVVSGATVNATTTRDEAERNAEALVAEAKQRAKSLREAAQAALDLALQQGTRIEDEAKQRAAEIAGSAYRAMENAERYENVVRAMKNVLEGYGDRYIVPSHSLLDDLAEEFGFAEAGQALKQARDLTRSMARSGAAATCDYVEAYRRTTAIAFVVDAFNGKVDSILSRVKNDNAGTLGQEIRDAFDLVNHNGKAFRDARIVDSYLRARLDELRWAAAAQELKLQEREEQRRAKELIREEERARREFERAIRDAAKEEEALRKAMEKTQLQVERATDEQRAKFEAQLEELSIRLRAAEERNQRALSMAQQTRRGNVYVISNVGSFGEDVFKIGLTRRLEPLDRVRELGDSSVPFEFDVHAMILAEDAPALETRLHKHFVLSQVNKVNHRKEFFRARLQDIRAEIEGMGLETRWTMAADAREYRETLAIERTIQTNPAAREAWLRRQLALEDLMPAFDEESQEAAVDAA